METCQKMCRPRIRAGMVAGYNVPGKLKVVSGSQITHQNHGSASSTILPRIVPDKGPASPYQLV